MQQTIDVVFDFGILAGRKQMRIPYENQFSRHEKRYRLRFFHHHFNRRFGKVIGNDRKIAMLFFNDRFF